MPKVGTVLFGWECRSRGRPGRERPRHSQPILPLPCVINERCRQLQFQVSSVVGGRRPRIGKKARAPLAGILEAPGAWLSSRSVPEVAPEVPHLRQPCAVVLLVHEFAWRRDRRPTPAAAETRLTPVRLVRTPRRHRKPCQALSELPVRKCPIRGTGGRGESR